MDYIHTIGSVPDTSYLGNLGMKSIPLYVVAAKYGPEWCRNISVIQRGFFTGYEKVVWNACVLSAMSRRFEERERL